MLGGAQMFMWLRISKDTFIDKWRYINMLDV